MGHEYADIGDRQSEEPRQAVVVTALGITQIFAWGCSYYLPAVLAKPIAVGTGWPLAWVVGGLSLGLVVAGFASPSVGSAIQNYGGRAVLAVSSILLATGLIAVGFSQNIATYLAGWVVIGLGMGAGLYDPAFATLGRIYRERARNSISLLTLFGGFSSTICWPLSWWLVQTAGWRSTCLIYAGLQLAMSLPIYLLLLPSVGPPKANVTAKAAPPSAIPVKKKLVLVFALLAAAITLTAVIQATMSVHLLNILQNRGVALRTAVILGTVVGPSQVLARVVEMIVGRRFHPIWTMVTSWMLVAGGLGLLSLDLSVIAVGLVLHGAGMGIMSIARGTVPLALLGASDYAVLMGRLAAPSLLAQAISPLIAAVILESIGATGVLFALCGVALANLVIVAALALCATRSQSFSLRDTAFPASSSQ